jgi:hypothetical protein
LLCRLYELAGISGGRITNNTASRIAETPDGARIKSGATGASDVPDYDGEPDLIRISEKPGANPLL